METKIEIDCDDMNVQKFLCFNNFDVHSDSCLSLYQQDVNIDRDSDNYREVTTKYIGDLYIDELLSAIKSFDTLRKKRQKLDKFYKTSENN